MSNFLHITTGVMLLACAVVGCTTQQQQQAAGIAQAALTAAQSACAGAQQAKGIALATAKGGALGTVSKIAQYIDATCQAEALAAAVAADPATAAWVKGMGTALTASTAAPVVTP